MDVTRRFALAAGAATLAVPALAFGADTDRRLVVIVLRGGLDGLAAAPPVGDPAYASARGALALNRADTLALDSTFALHPRLATLHGLWQARELVLVHAASTPYRERSHFDAQNMLETGAARPFARDSGWLNAALGAMPRERGAGRRELGLAVAQQAPLLLRGPANVATWSPSPLPDVNADTLGRLMDLYRRRDPALATALESAIAANETAGGAMVRTGGGRAVAPLARAAAGFLKRADGPVAVVLEVTGWDTHANQGAEAGALATNLGMLDAGIAALKTDLGGVWRTTTVMVVTEFGRTVAPNGNRGSDHGTGAAAFVCGGAVAGGRILADWPGLAPAQRLEGRDLRPTTDIRGVLKGVLRDHLGVPDGALRADLFPDGSAVAPVSGLIRG